MTDSGGTGLELGGAGESVLIIGETDFGGRPKGEPEGIGCPTGEFDAFWSPMGEFDLEGNPTGEPVLIGNPSGDVVFNGGVRTTSSSFGGTGGAGEPGGDS